MPRQCTGPLVRIERASLFIPGLLPRRNILHDIDWEIQAGSHCAITGVNGSGKSTLLRLIHGDLWASSGRISWHIDGIWEDSPIMGKSMVGLVSPMAQEKCQRMGWDVSARDMLLSGMEDQPVSFASSPSCQAASQDRIEKISARLHMEQLLSMRLPALSQGQLRIVLLARALLRHPPLLLLDECADGLDRCHKAAIFSILEEYSRNTTIIFASHREDEIPAWCAERCYIENGRLSLETGKKNAHGIDASPPVSGIRVSEPGAAGPSGNEDSGHTQSRQIKEKGQILLHLDNVSVYIERNLVLKNIDWQIRRGEHWKISGDNGSGKSTLLRLVAGDEFAAAGGHARLWFSKAGRWAKTLAEKRQCAILVSDLSQALYAYNLNGLDLVCTGFDNSIGIYREITDAERSAAMDALRMFFPRRGAQKAAETPIRALSTGELRRLFLARAIVRKPGMLLLDEPCSGLDAESRSRYIEFLDLLAKKGHNGWKPNLVFVSHYGGDTPGCVTREAEVVNGILKILH